MPDLPADVQQHISGYVIADTFKGMPFHLACYKGDIPEVLRMIHVGADINDYKSQLITPVHIAVLQGNCALVNLLLSLGADRTKADWRGQTPLMSAVHRRHEQVVKLLLEHRPDTREEQEDETQALCYAAANGDAQLVKHFVHAKVFLNGLCNGLTPVFIAAEKGHAEVVEILVKAGANTQSPTEDGVTPLIAAVTNGHVRVVELLLNLEPHHPRLSNECFTEFRVTPGKDQYKAVELLLDNPIIDYLNVKQQIAF